MPFNYCPGLAHTSVAFLALALTCFGELFRLVRQLRKDPEVGKLPEERGGGRSAKAGGPGQKGSLA